MPADGGRPTRGALALRTRLLAAMLGPLLVVAVIIGVIGATVIADVVRRTNDRVLGGALGAIAETVQVERGEVTLDLPAAAFGMLENSERDNVYYRIAVGDEVLTGYADLPAPRIDELTVDQPRFRFARYRDADIRIGEVKRLLPRIDRPVVVQVAETLDGRRALTRTLTIALLIGEIVLVGIAVLLVRPALGWSLRPLARLRGAVEMRDGAAAPDLSPLDTGPLPVELQPLSAAFDRLLARLDDATAGVRRFTADASHQMRTPLSVLKVQVALARRGSADALDEIADAIDRLERLVTQLLALARADEAGRSAPLETVDLRELGTAVISRRFGEALEAGVDLTLDIAEGERFLVAGYRTLMFEILSNLVDNGIRYNRRGGYVAIAILRRDGRIVVRVEDDGPGIPAADRDRVFERFIRLESTDTHGSGLGLAIVRSAALRLGATVWFDDPAQGLAVEIAFPEHRA